MKLLLRGCKMPLMARPKNKPSAAAGQKARRQVGIPEPLAAVMDAHARAELKSLTDLVREWCIECAKARGIWPPKDAPGKA